MKINMVYITKLFKVKIVQEKQLAIPAHRGLKPYLKSTTSKLVENTKALEKSIIKELGKLTHVTSG